MLNFIESIFPYQDWLLTKQESDKSQLQNKMFDFQPISLDLVNSVLTQPNH